MFTAHRFVSCRARIRELTARHQQHQQYLRRLERRFPHQQHSSAVWVDRSRTQRVHRLSKRARHQKDRRHGYSSCVISSIIVLLRNLYVILLWTVHEFQVKLTTDTGTAISPTIRHDTGRGMWLYFTVTVWISLAVKAVNVALGWFESAEIFKFISSVLFKVLTISLYLYECVCSWCHVWPVSISSHVTIVWPGFTEPPLLFHK